MLRSIVIEALAALRFNRQRTLLTVVSLAWGVTCFVILYSYGEGFGFALTTCFKAVGSDLILIFGGQTSTQAGGERAGHKVVLDVDDVDAIRDSVPLVGAISPEMMMYGTPVTHEYRTKNLEVRAGIPSDYQKVRNMSVESGRWLSGEDSLRKERVAVLGAKAAGKLFGEEPPEGEKITISGLQFQVVGVLKTKVQISNYNMPDNECVFIPYSTASLLKNTKHPDVIVWSPINPRFRQEAVRQVRATLARLHNFNPTDERAAEFIVFNEFMKQIDMMSAALQILLGFIGTLTLAIGGIGLANIMLVSVTQRTKEIGVLKSLGATRRWILFQFLLEAMAIVTAGGAIGVGLAWILTSTIGSLPLLGPLFKDTSGQGDIHLGISSFSIVVSTVMLELVGLISGFLPAFRASRLEAIEALRYE